MEEANAALAASNQQEATIIHSTPASAGGSTFEASRFTFQAGLASLPPKPASTPTWRHATPYQARWTAEPQGMVRFINLPSPEFYVIDWSDGEDEDMEDIEV